MKGQWCLKDLWIVYGCHRILRFHTYTFFFFQFLCLLREQRERERRGIELCVCVCFKKKNNKGIYIYKDREDVASYMGNR